MLAPNTTQPPSTGHASGGLGGGGVDCEAGAPEVESLLAHDSTDPTRTSATISDARESTYRTGTVIGPFKILSTLGEGGMGVVYLAEQTEPVRRRVALKVIKAGMDTRQVIARFEAERQALAIMSHPGIAQVFEAGTTEEGRPYFVMEYVDGQKPTNNPKSNPKSKGRDKGEGAQGRNRTKVQHQNAEGCPRGPEKTTKKSDPKWDRGPTKRRTPRGGKAKGRGDGRRKAKKGDSPKKNI